MRQIRNKFSNVKVRCHRGTVSLHKEEKLNCGLLKWHRISWSLTSAHSQFYFGLKSRQGRPASSWERAGRLIFKIRTRKIFRTTLVKHVHTLQDEELAMIITLWHFFNLVKLCQACLSCFLRINSNKILKPTWRYKCVCMCVCVRTRVYRTRNRVPSI